MRTLFLFATPGPPFITFFLRVFSRLRLPSSLPPKLLIERICFCRRGKPNLPYESSFAIYYLYARISHSTAEN